MKPKKAKLLKEATVKRMLRVTPQQFESGEAGRLVRLALEAIE